MTPDLKYHSFDSAGKCVISYSSKNSLLSKIGKNIAQRNRITEYLKILILILSVTIYTLED